MTGPSTPRPLSGTNSAWSRGECTNPVLIARGRRMNAATRPFELVPAARVRVSSAPYGGRQVGAVAPVRLARTEL